MHLHGDSARLGLHVSVYSSASCRSASRLRARFLDHRHDNILWQPDVSIVGAVIAGLLFGGSINSGLTIETFLYSLIGAIILLAIVNLVRRVVIHPCRRSACEHVGARQADDEGPAGDDTPVRHRARPPADDSAEPPPLMAP